MPACGSEAVIEQASLQSSMTASHTRQPQKSKEERESRGWRRQRLMLCSCKRRISGGSQTSTLSRGGGMERVQSVLGPLSLQSTAPINLYGRNLHSLWHFVIQAQKTSTHSSLLFFLNKIFAETNECTRRGFHISFQNSLSYSLHDSQRVLWVP